MTCGAKASLISTKSATFGSIPARLAAAVMAGTGPIPILVGSTPTTAYETSSARGVSPSRSTASPLARTSEAAPSHIPDAEAGVTTPPFLKVVGSAASFSRVVARACSSVAKSCGPFFDLSVMGAISSENFPASLAAAQRCCEVRAYTSDSSRLMPYSSARFSAVMPIGQPAWLSVRPAHSVSVKSRFTPRRVPQRMSWP
mmetsp:Transcript_49785/g.82608  ORF Transcript_49785/g.82608 Transcript_49785/m.82608 type:complete len:200 (-) Transcript_49785:355-954(-)